MTPVQPARQQHEGGGERNGGSPHVLRIRRWSSSALSLTFLLALSVLFTSGCFMNKGAQNDTVAAPPLEENKSIGPLPAIDPGKVDTIISGNPEAAAEALLEVTLDERSALACVGLLLPRLGECGEKMDDAVLVREEGQPVWMRLYRNSYDYSQGLPGRKHQILLRLADCIREATPSPERATARGRLFTAIRNNLLVDASSHIEIATRAVMFTAPFSFGVDAETGWNDLFELLDSYIFSTATASEPTRDQATRIAGVYSHYCVEHPDFESQIVDKIMRAPRYCTEFSKQVEFNREMARAPSLGRSKPCSESLYRAILKKSTHELIDLYAVEKHNEATGVVKALLTGTRQARLESFPLVKPYLETYRESRTSYYQWVSLLAGYCVPLAENSSAEEIERQAWIMDELTGQIERGERGDPKFGTDPIRLLRFLIVTVGEADRDPRERVVQRPYGRDRVLQVLLEQTVSTNTSAAESALRELDVLCSFDASTARTIEQGLTARKDRILTNQYPSDDFSATSKEDLYQAMELGIKRAQAALK